MPIGQFPQSVMMCRDGYDPRQVGDPLGQEFQLVMGHTHYGQVHRNGHNDDLLKT